MAPHVAIARGWERQLDTYRNGLFYDESAPLTAARYRAWLSEQAISYVALPDAPLDYSAAEARLRRRARLRSAGGPAERSRLREVWRSAHWRLFAVLGARAARAGARRAHAAGQRLVHAVARPRPGRYLARVRFTPYWALSRGSGCVREAPGGWTELRGLARGQHARGDRLLARARVRPRRALPLSIV